MLCPHCGKLLRADATFCDCCEKKLAKKKRKVRGFSLFFVAVVLLAVCASFLLVLRTSPKAMIEGAIYQKIEEEKIYLSRDQEELPLYLQYTNAVTSAVEFTVQEVDHKERCAQVSFSYVDVMALADQYSGPENDPDTFYRYCIKSIRDDEAPKRTEEIILFYKIEKSEGEKACTIEDTPELVNVLIGGVYTELMSVLEGVK